MVRAKANRSNSDYSSIDDLSLPRNQSARSGLPGSLPCGIRERSNSDSNLNLSTPQSWSTLTVDRRECQVGHGFASNVIVSWDIKEDVAAQDWIGLYLAGKQMCGMCVTVYVYHACVCVCVCVNMCYSVCVICINIFYNDGVAPLVLRASDSRSKDQRFEPRLHQERKKKVVRVFLI